MDKIVEEWKDERLPIKQIELNRKELFNYPDHWKSFIYLIKYIEENENMSKYNLIDLGCGVGTTYKLIKDNNILCNYIGYDFSEHMINTAKTEWNYNNFFVKDITKIDNLGYNNIIYCTGLLDILPNSDIILNNILKHNAKYVILNRINISDNESITTYKAYDIINCYKYIFNYNTFINIINNNNYTIKMRISHTAFLLQYNKNETNDE